MRNSDRERAITEIVSRIVNRYVETSQESKRGSVSESILEWVNETLYDENKRLRTEPESRMKQEDRSFWSKIKRDLPRANEKEIRDILVAVVRRFTGEVAGNFDPRIYNLSVNVIPYGLSFLLNGLSLRKILRDPVRAFSLDTNIHISGQVRELLELQKRGTIVMVPTHVSNLDSPVIGWSIYKMGLPPFTYGAGLNLFHNQFLGFFMRNLGAYRVDRRKNSRIYKDVLKEYATLSLEYGYNNLFFPGGTRNRTGEVERRLKKGLLGTTVQAYTHNLQNKKENPNLYIVPCTLNYHLVLEASTLIEDALKETGKKRYIIEDDESANLKRIYQFTTSLAHLDAPIHVVVGQAYDPFGNRVDIEGKSYDRRGREVDITRYVLRNGKPVVDLQRDQEYTNEVADRIVDEFVRHNMILNTHLLAYTVFQMLRDKNKDMDLYRLLHTGGFYEMLPIQEVCEAVDAHLERVRMLAQQGEVEIAPYMNSGSARDLVDAAMRIFGMYHNPPVLRREGDQIVPGQLSLLYYYHNRLNGYPMEAQSQPIVLAEKRTEHSETMQAERKPETAQPEPASSQQAVA